MAFIRELKFKILAIDHFSPLQLLQKMDLNNIASQLRSAIQQFLDHRDFTSAGNTIFKQKQKQLISFSKQAQCVPVCIHILESESDQKINYFASMLLKDKLKYDFYQLQENAVSQTYAMLVNLIKKLENPNKVLLTNIVLCLVYIYIHSIERIGTVTQFFEMTFAGNVNQQQQSQQQTEMKNKNKFLYYFKFLELLSQEIQNPKLVIDQQSRDQASKLLQSQQTQVLEQMHTLFNSFNSQQNKLSFVQQQILLHAFAGWLQLNSSNQKIIYSLHHHSLMNLAANSLDDDLIFQAAGRCMTMAIEIMVLPQNNQQMFLFLTHKLIGSIHKFDQLLKQCNFQIVEQFVKVLCEYGSVSCDVLISKYNESVQNFLVHMLSYLEIPQIDAFPELIEFWQSFLQALKKNNENSLLTKQTSDQIIGKLLITLFNKLKYQLSDLQMLNQISQSNLRSLHQRAEDLDNFREQGGYIFYTISEHIGKENYVKQLLTLIVGLDQNQASYWSLVESMLSSLREAVEKYPGPTQEVCQLVILYEKLNPGYIMIKRSFLRLFSELFEMQIKSQEFILKILGYVVAMLQIPLLADRAERAFSQCCKFNPKIVAKHIESVYDLINVYPNRKMLLEGIAYVLKQSPEMITSLIPNLLSIQIQKMSSTLSSAEISKSEKKKRLIITFENIFSLLKCVPSKNLSDSHIAIVQGLLQKIWPFLIVIIANPFKKQTDEDKVVQECIKLVKTILRMIPEQFLPFLEQISAEVIQSYQKHPLSSFVYFYQIVLTQYRNHPQPQIQNFLLLFFTEICTITFKHIQQFGGIGNLAILADDFLGLAKRVVTYNKLSLLLQSNKVDDIFKLAIMGLQSEQSRVASSSSQFFQIVFMIYWTPYSRTRYAADNIGEIVEYDPKSVQLYDQLRLYLLPMVPKTILDLFQSLQKVPIQSARDNIIDCLMAISLAFPNQSQQLWSEPLSQIETDILTSSEKTRIIKSVQGLSSNDAGQFNNNEIKLGKLLFTVSKRYMNRSSRQKMMTQK